MVPNLPFPTKHQNQIFPVSAVRPERDTSNTSAGCRCTGYPAKRSGVVEFAAEAATDFGFMKIIPPPALPSLEQNNLRATFASCCSPFLWAVCFCLLTGLPASAAETNQLALWGAFTLVDETPRILGRPRYSGELLMKNVRSVTRSSSPLYVVRTDGRITAWKPWGHVDAVDLPPLPGVISLVHASELEHFGVLAALLGDGQVAVYLLGEWRFLPGLTEVVALTYGASSLLALRADGTAVQYGISPEDQPIVAMHRVTQVAGWGSIAGLVHGDGEVAILGWDSGGRTNVPPGLRGVMELAVGRFLVVALKEDGSLVGWGIPEATPPPGMGNVVSVAVGEQHALARTADGRVIAWGNNAEGQTEVPPGLSNVVAIAAGRAQSVALRADGAVVAWGSNRDGQTAIPRGIRDATQIAAWGDQTLAIGIPRAPVLASQPAALQIPRHQNAHLTVEALGFGPHVYQWFCDGRLVAPPSSRPRLDFPGNLSVPGPGTYTVRVANVAGTITSEPALVEIVEPLAGTVVAWKHRDGIHNRQSLIPPGLSNVVALASGGNHVLALTAGGTVVSWGGSKAGDSIVPEGLRDVIAIAAAYNRSMALRVDGSVVEWGANQAIYRPPGIEHPMAIALGPTHALALDADGRVVSWANEWPPDRRPPEGISDAIGVAINGASSVVLFQDGSVKSWGPIFSSCSVVPMPVGLSGIRSIQSGMRTLMALGADGDIHAWGNDCHNVATPPNVRGILSAAIAYDVGAALVEGGEVVKWGQQSLHLRPPIQITWAIAADAETLYEIVGPPVAAPLRVQQTPSSTALIWRPFTRREVLEFTKRLDAPQWRPVSGEPRRYNDLLRLELPASSPTGYYRLVTR